MMFFRVRSTSELLIMFGKVFLTFIQKEKYGNIIVVVLNSYADTWNAVVSIRSHECVKSVIVEDVVNERTLMEKAFAIKIADQLKAVMHGVMLKVSGLPLVGANIGSFYVEGNGGTRNRSGT